MKHFNTSPIIKILLVVYSLLSVSCSLIMRPPNNYKHLEGRTVVLKDKFVLYEADSTLTHTKEPYFIAHHHYLSEKNIKLPIGTKFHVNKSKHIRSLTVDDWFLTGHVLLKAKRYDCAYEGNDDEIELVE